MIASGRGHEWRTLPLSEVVELRRGFDLPSSARKPGPFPVLSAGMVVDYHSEYQVDRAGLAIGRATNLGRPTWADGPHWPLNTTLYAADFKGNHPKFIFHLFESLDLTGFDSGSVQPMLNRNYIAGLKVTVPPVAQQRAIAEALGALDDKIAANARVATAAERLAEVLYAKHSAARERVPASRLLEPVLGGTPDRDNASFWTGDVNWISAKDITGAMHGVILNTIEHISDEAASITRAKPVPKGSVILTARGTVGAVARLGVDSAFNQSCYAFTPGSLPPGVLYFTVKEAANNALSVAHGSVFSTITMRSFDAMLVPEFEPHERAALESMISPLLDRATRAAVESRRLVSLRDTLLPQLMAGRITVRSTGTAV